jgi:adenylate kinase family enzyme
MGQVKSILLLGATGTGKTPLGDCLAERGLWGRRCAHFDFGASLRAVDSGEIDGVGLSDREREVVSDVLHRGVLLENEQFGIAEKILRRFLADRGVRDGDVVVLNGLPRHVDQALDVDRILDVCGVVFLSCEPETVMRRIRSNAGGDRAARVDDDVESVRRRLADFDARTRPLLDQYRAKGVRIEIVTVDETTQPEDIRAQLELPTTDDA